MRLRLQVRQSADKSFSWELTAPVARVGRDPSCELSLQGDGTQSVSWNHARLELHGEGAFVSDVGSSNGTYVNGKRIEGRTALHLGDRVELGRTGPKLLVAQLEGATPPPRVATAFEARPSPPVAKAIAAGIPAAPVAPPPVRAAPVVAPPVRAGDERSVSGGTTRMLLVKLQSSQRRNMMLLGAAVATIAVLMLIIGGLLIAFGVWSLSSNKKGDLAQADSGSAGSAETGRLKPEQIFEKALPSTVWVVVPQGRPNAYSFGSGSLVDRERKLIITAQHVVGDRPDVAVFFPHYDTGRLNLKKKEYIDRAKSLGIEGRVVARDVKRDLALIELETVPADVPALSIADESPLPGHTVYSIGNPGLTDIDMWMLTTGTVRQVHQKQWAYVDRAPREAWAIETQSPVNPGDSGGPVVNGEGKLVAVVAGGKGDSNLMTFFIDRREIVDLLNKTR
jgi:S1-C subfamily serine protease/pSer/pThr/pTyr-binding forkhead associated (FHA) protein